MLIVFGPKRLPEMGRSLGRGMREFKDSISTAMPTEEELEGKPQEDPDAARPVPTVVQATAAPSAPAGEGGSTRPRAGPERRRARPQGSGQLDDGKGGTTPMPLGIFRNFGVWEILILLFVVLLFFGPKRLPEMGRSLGRGMREFKDSITGKGRTTRTRRPRSRPC